MGEDRREDLRVLATLFVDAPRLGMGMHFCANYMEMRS